MKLADELLEKAQKQDEASIDKAGEAEKSATAVIETLKKESFGGSNDDQKKMVELMGKLAESDADSSNKFMKSMDEAASAFGTSGSDKKKADLEKEDAEGKKIPAKKV